MLLKSINKHTILISLVSKQCILKFQLYRNVPQLDALMNELEKQYYGIGASTVSMPDEYLVSGRLCVGVCPLEEDWHRCEIVHVYVKRKKVKLYFIGYGGEAEVDFDKVKFLRREFGVLPVQAMNTKLANVNLRPNETLKNYMLSRVTNKPLLATITGVIDDDVFCLEIVDVHTSPVSLNARIILDGHGESCDDTKRSGVTNTFFIYSFKCDKIGCLIFLNIN
jgi:hypothetical protein